MVYEPGRVLIEAWDAGYSHVLLERHLPESLIDRFRRSLWEDGALLPLIVPPIVVDSKSDVFQLYEYTDLLDHHLEPWYPREEIQDVYDSRGLLLELAVEEKEVRSFFGRSRTVEGVVVRALEDAPRHANQLAAALRRALQGPELGGPVSSDRLEGFSLDELILEALRHHKPR